MNRTQKEESVATLKEKFAKAPHAFVTEYRGLKVSEMTDLRREVRKTEGEFGVVKNRLAKRGVAGSSMAGLEGFFKGPTAVVWGRSDAAQLAKFLVRFKKDYPLFKIKAGFLDGRLIKEAEIEELAKLPSKEELYAKLLGVLIGPAARLARTLQAIPQKLVGTLDALAKKQ